MNVDLAGYEVCVALGILLQLGLMLRSPDHDDLGLELPVSIALAFGGTLPIVLTGNYEPARHFLVWAVGFAFCMAIACRERLMPFAHGNALALWSAIFVYAMVSAGSAQSAVLTVAGLGTVACVFAIKPGRRPFWLQISLYGWTLVAIAGLAVLQMRWGDIGVLLGGQLPSPSLVSAFLTGMGVTAVLVYATFIALLLFPPTGRSSWALIVMGWRREAEFAIGYLLSDAGRPIPMLIIAATVAAAGAVNASMGWASPWIVAALLLVLVPPVFNAAVTRINGPAPESAPPRDYGLPPSVERAIARSFAPEYVEQARGAIAGAAITSNEPQERERMQHAIVYLAAGDVDALAAVARRAVEYPDGVFREAGLATWDWIDVLQRRGLLPRKRREAAAGARSGASDGDATG